jgi:hypothetical protein
LFVGIGTTNPGYALDITGNVNINNTIVSSNSTTGGLIINGGISINNTTDATSFTSGGGLTISGGASIDQTLYARFLVTTNTTIQNLNTSNFTSVSALITNLTTGALYVTGGSVLNDITANNITTNNITANLISSSNLYSTTATLPNLITTNVTSETLNVNLGLTTGSLYVTGGSVLNNITTNLISSNNLISTNITTGTFSTTLATISNLQSTSGTFGNLAVINDLYVGGSVVAVNVTTLNLIDTNISTGTLNAIGITTNSLLVLDLISTSNLYSTTATLPNLISTNITSETINVNLGLTGGSLYITGGSILNGITSSTLLVTGLISASNLFSTTATLPNLISTNISSSTISATTSTIPNFVTTNISTNNIQGNSGTFGNFAVSNNLYVGGSIVAVNVTTINQIHSNISTGTINAINITTNSLFISGTGPSYNSTTASLVLFNGGLSINETENAINVSSGGGLTNAGGLSVAKDIFIGGTSNFFNTMNLNNNLITNVTSPNSPLDAVNKYYMDRRFNNLTQGQVVITDAPTIDGNNIKSFSTFTYDGTLLSILSTTLATSISNGGTFITYGGATIQGNLIVGLGIDANNHYITNVATPIYPGDGVNKKYVDDLFFNCGSYGTNYDDLFENSKIIDTQVSSLLTELSYDGNVVKAFIAYVYVRIVGLTMGLYIIKGFYNGTTWIINTQSIGNYTNTSFSIITDNLGVGTINCYNPLVLDPIYVKYRKSYELQLTDINLLSVTLNNNVNTPIDIPGLQFINANTVGFKCAVIIKTPTKNALFLLTGLNKNGIWIVSYYFFGDPDTQVALSILSQPTYGQIQYTNANTSGVVTVQAENIILLGNQVNYTLLANTNIFTEIPDITFNINQTSNFTLTVYIEVPGSNLYAIMEINSLVIYNQYSINTVYSGDNTNVTFEIIDGVLNYKNTNGVNAIMKYNVNLAPFVNPLCVGKGGTGRNDLLPFSILRGNGQDPIVGTEDLIYQNNNLVLGNTSKILLNNTEDVVGNNGGTIITNGGINVVKSAYIGGSLDIQTGSLLYKTGVLSLNNTKNATGLTNGTLVNYGGTSLVKDLFVGGVTKLFNTLNMNNNYIQNVPTPILGSDGVNKDYVDSIAADLSGNFTAGQVIIGDVTGSEIRGFDTLTFDGSKLVLNGILYATTSTLPNLTTTNLSASSINVNSVTSSNIYSSNVNSSNLYSTTSTLPNVVSINLSTGSLNVNSITSNSLLTSNLVSTMSTLENIISTNISSGTINSFGITSNSLTVTGTSNFFNTMNLNNNLITNVTSPNSPLDAVNKYYMDRRFNNLTQGQVVITDAPTIDGNNIKSFNSFTYDGTLLSLHSTTLATSISNGGTFISNGGATIQGNLIVGLGIDANNHYVTNVATPIYPGDGVNKQYVDDLFFNCGSYGTNYDDLFENSKIIDIQSSSLLTELSYDGNVVKVFIVYVYVRIVGLTMGLYIIKGFYNGTTWIINTQSIGNYTNTSFSIITDNLGVGTINCYNPLVLDPIYVKYRKSYELQLTDINLLSVTLNNNVNTPIDIPGLQFINANTVGFKCAVIIKTPTKNALFLLTGLNKNGIWIVSYYFFGDPDTQVALSILSQPTYGQIQYTNANTSGVVTVQAENIVLLGNQTNYTLLANTNIFTEIPDITFNINKTSNFTLTVYVEVPGSSLYAIMEIHSLVIYNQYSINTVYSGDNTNVTFEIIDGVLNYKNTNGVNAIMKYNVNLAPFVNPLCVGKGGTGASDLLPFSILRGNGQDPIVGTEDLIYQNNNLVLGNESKILLNNTEDVVGNNGGTIITNGGINISKSAYIGGSLDVQTGVLSLNNTINATGLTNGTLVNYGGAAIQKDLFVGGNLFLGGEKINIEQTFLANNGTFIAEAITNFVFDNSLVRYFTAMVSVCKTSTLNTISTGHEIKGIQTDSGWVLSNSTIGNNTSVYFSIDSLGQMMYTSNSIGNWISTVIKFRMLTLHVT